MAFSERRPRKPCAHSPADPPLQRLARAQACPVARSLAPRAAPQPRQHNPTCNATQTALFALALFQGQLAGLNVLSIIDEPTAAAIAYGMDLQAAKAQTTLVFDLGGGTFDVSLVTIRNGRYKVLATNGDTHLGGEDIDNKLIEHFNKALADQQVDNASLTPEDQMQVKQAAERVKIELSSASEATFKVTLSSGAQHQVPLARDEFLKMNKPIFDRCMDVVERVLKDAKSIDAAFTKKSVDEVVLVGGSTRIPHISKLLKDYFKREPSSGIDPDEAVAYGAAIQAAILSGDKSVQGMHVFGVTPMDLGILIHGATPEENRMAVIIPHNTPIPAEMTMPFKTVVDNQIAIKVEVVQGDEKDVANVTSLGEFTLLDGLPPNQPAGETSIQITFALDGDGIFSVSAKDLESDHEKATIIEKYKSPTGEQPAAALERRKNLAKQISTWNRGVLPPPAEKPGP